MDFDKPQLEARKIYEDLLEAAEQALQMKQQRAREEYIEDICKADSAYREALIGSLVQEQEKWIDKHSIEPIPGWSPPPPPPPPVDMVIHNPALVDIERMIATAGEKLAKQVLEAVNKHGAN